MRTSLTNANAVIEKMYSQSQYNDQVKRVNSLTLDVGIIEDEASVLKRQNICLKEKIEKMLEKIEKMEAAKKKADSKVHFGHAH